MSLLDGDQRVAVWLAQDKVCPLCDKAIPEADLFDVNLINVDHKVPSAHGGSDEFSNLQLVHRPCNEAKGCGCGGHCEISVGQVQSFRHVWKRQAAWRRQGNQCYLCNEVILPSELVDDEVSYYELGRVYHLACWRRGGSFGLVRA